MLRFAAEPKLGALWSPTDAEPLRLLIVDSKLEVLCKLAEPLVFVRLP